MSDHPIAVRPPDQSVAVFSSSQSFAAAQVMAKQLSRSTIVPEAYRGEQGEANILIALEMSNRIGASVMAVMQAMTPIHGKPTWSATFLIATVNTCGRFTPLRFRFSGTPGQDDHGCRAVAKDRDTQEELVGSLVTIGMAKAEGWYGKNGSKWKTMPEQMLQYRAAAFWTRAYAPELSFGMHTDDEARDIQPTQPSAPPTPVNVTPTTPTPVVPVVEATVVETPQQRLHRLFKERSISWSAVKGFITGRGYLTDGQTIRDLSDDHAELLCGMIDSLAAEFGKGAV